ncbi:MAG: hypothetical protein U1E63_15255 [Burkholderiales bacterium]
MRRESLRAGLTIDRFGNEIGSCSQEECLASGLGGVAAGDDQHGHLHLALVQDLLHVKTADPRHVQVEHHTAFRQAITRRLQKLGARGECFRGKSGRRDQPHQGHPNVGIVVHDRHDWWSLVRHDA